MTWLLLIYTLPAEPSRKRAAVWRDLKKVGAVYLRDGVCALPERDDTQTALAAIAERVEAFGGQATLVTSAQLPPDRAESVIAQASAARAEEYGELVREAERLLGHIRYERKHREFAFPELEELEADVGKLRRWAGQIRARDHFGVPEAAQVDHLLARCKEVLAAFREDTYARDEAAQ